MRTFQEFLPVIGIVGKCEGRVNFNPPYLFESSLLNSVTEEKDGVVRANVSVMKTENIAAQDVNISEVHFMVLNDETRKNRNGYFWAYLGLPPPKKQKKKIQFLLSSRTHLMCT